MRRVFLPFVLFLSMASALWSQPQKSLSLNIAGETLVLEIARTPEEQKIGLMGRTKLADNAGMIFLFDSPRFIGFWMKDTPLDLDIAFVDAKGFVFHTDTMLANTSDIHYSYGPAAAAIEVKKGHLRKLGIGPGTRIPELSVLLHSPK